MISILPLASTAGVAMNSDICISRYDSCQAFILATCVPRRRPGDYDRLCWSRAHSGWPQSPLDPVAAVHATPSQSGRRLSNFGR